MAGSLADKKIMVAGHICLDIAPKFPSALCGGIGEVLTPGKLVNIDEAVLCTGGAVSNTGLALAKLGADVVLNGKVGQDEFGAIIKRLVGERRAAAFKTVEGQNTSYTIILAIPGVDRILLHNPGTNDTFGADDVDYDAAAKCLLFHFGYPPLMKRMYQNGAAELIEIFRRVKALGVTTSLDMTPPDPASESGRVDWAGVLERLLPYVDIFLPSIEEIAYMLDRDLFARRKREAKDGDVVHAYKTADYEMLSGKILRMGTKIAALKSGIRGYCLRTDDVKAIGKAAPKDAAAWSNRELWAASFKAEPFCSAAGAGDATIAGFLAGLVGGFGPEESLRIANTLGWENVRAIDTLSGIEDWEATLKYVADKSRKFNSAGLDASWRFDAGSQIYHGANDKV